TTNTGAGDVTVLLGNGNGTFQNAVNYAAGSRPVYVAVADLDGDGKQDLVVANEFTTNVLVLLGNGDGSFQSAASYTVDPDPYGVAVADFNRDGRLDLAVSSNQINPSGNVSILLGNGDGTFQPKSDFAAAGNVRHISVGDFNGDGLLD